MKIYTKSGDSGMTSLAGGERVSKNHPRVEAYGNVDELISVLGLMRSVLPSENDPLLRRIQTNLMMCAAGLASERSLDKVKQIKEEEISFLESEIDRMDRILPRQNAFILPSSPKESSLCHIARCVCRRAERSITSIDDNGDYILLINKYLNRLSDFLFVFGRYQCNYQNISEDFWLP